MRSRVGLMILDKPLKFPRILVIRRDNIGDLVCTTPLIRSLRKQLPGAWIAALVTHYNQAVMEKNPDIDALFSYTKTKHLKPGESRVVVFWNRLVTIWKLRRQHFDWILLPGGSQRSSLRFARWIGAKRILVRDHEDEAGGSHHVEQCCHQLVRMGLQLETPMARVTPDPVIADKIKGLFPREWNNQNSPLIALHLSSRKPSQRWPAERFSALVQSLHEKANAKFLLLWSPGTIDNRQHPGDDENAHCVLESTLGLPIHPVPTKRLEELIAALSLCDSIICSDGGTMHLAAALEKPVVALFGDSNPKYWGPWKVPHTVLQKPSRDVSAISVEEVVDAFVRLTEASKSSSV